MVALCVVLAQMGSFVPADAMTFGLYDRIFTRIGAAEDIASGRSTFLVEMTEVSTIIHQASADSLVVLDEVGRGTATYDGMALAEAIVEHSAHHHAVPWDLRHHYHHLVEMIGDLPGIACFQMGVQQDGERLIFLHTLQPGVAAGSFGIAVARDGSACLPRSSRAPRPGWRCWRANGGYTSRIVVCLLHFPMWSSYRMDKPFSQGGADVGKKPSIQPWDCPGTYPLAARPA